MKNPIELLFMLIINIIYTSLQRYTKEVDDYKTDCKSTNYFLNHQMFCWFSQRFCETYQMISEPHHMHCMKGYCYYRLPSSLFARNTVQSWKKMKYQLVGLLGAELTGARLCWLTIWTSYPDSKLPNIPDLRSVLLPLSLL